jgi:hypothetical protein
VRADPKHHWYGQRPENEVRFWINRANDKVKYFLGNKKMEIREEKIRRSPTMGSRRGTVDPGSKKSKDYR